MPELAITAAELVATARARIEEIGANELIGQYGTDDLVIVDIRDIRERERYGFIPGAIHAARGMREFWIDPTSPYFKPVFGQNDKRYVFHCAVGWRSALAVAVLNDMGFACVHPREGFAGWRDSGGPTETPDLWSKPDA